MKSVRISDATYRAIADLAILPFRSTATRQADGTWMVPLSGETWNRLQARRLPDEDDDDLIQRIIRNYRGEKPS